MNRIKMIRISKGLKQMDLAAAAKISQPYLHDLENGIRGAKPTTWQRIAEALNVTVDELVEKDDEQCQSAS